MQMELLKREFTVDDTVQIGPVDHRPSLSKQCHNAVRLKIKIVSVRSKSADLSIRHKTQA